MSFKKPANKDLNCQECGAEVKNVAHDAVAVTCWRCTIKLVSKVDPFFEENLLPDDREQG